MFHFNKLPASTEKGEDNIVITTHPWKPLQDTDGSISKYTLFDKVSLTCPEYERTPGDFDRAETFIAYCSYNEKTKTYVPVSAEFILHSRDVLTIPGSNEHFICFKSGYGGVFHGHSRDFSVVYNPTAPTHL